MLGVGSLESASIIEAAMGYEVPPLHVKRSTPDPFGAAARKGSGFDGVHKRRRTCLDSPLPLAASFEDSRPSLAVKPLSPAT